MKPLLIACLLTFCACPAAHSFAGEDALLPPDGYRQVWKRSGVTKVFTAADLYGYIDGGAEIFFEFGFERLTVQRYSGGPKPGGTGAPGARLQVEIYRMTDPVAAAGVYLLKCGNETPELGFAQRHTINRFQLLFKRDRYFVLVNNLDGSDTARPAMLDFGRFIAGRMPVDGTLPLLEKLPREGLIEGSVRLIRGPFAMQSIYTLGEGDILQLRPGRTAVAGRYRDKAGEHTRVFAEYPNPESARKAFSNLRKNLDSYLQVQSEGADDIVLKDYAGKYGKASRTGNRILIVVQLARIP